jgi:hypothetical protein
MTIERTVDGWQLRLKSCGVGRYVSGAFLAFWLCGWAAGETFALWMLITGAVALLTGKPPGPASQPLELGPALMMGAFLVVWLTFWTIGGIAAFTELLRLLWGEDRITVASGRLTVTRRRGPFRSVRVFDRDAIRGVSLLGREDRLALETARERVELSRLGSHSERRDGATGLRAELGISEASSAAGTAIPKRWEEIITPGGERALVTSSATRRAQTRVASVATMCFAAVTFLVARQAFQRWDLMIAAFILLVFTAGLAAGTLWLARGRWEWRIGSGRLILRKRYGASVRDVFEGRRLMLDSTTDSDGDTWYELYAMSDAEAAPTSAVIHWRTYPPKNSRTIEKVMNDDTGVRGLASWLSQATGLPIEDRTTPQARQVQLVELRAMLEKSGRLGHWAAKLVDRLGEGSKKAG